MFPSRWCIWCLFLTLTTSAWESDVSGNDGPGVICSESLSNCSMKDVLPPPPGEHDSVDVYKLAAHFKLCCKNAAPCKLCLNIDAEINFHVQEEEHSGNDEEDNSEETRSPTASLTVCYKTAQTMPTCKKVEFTVNQPPLTQAKVSMEIAEPAGVSYGCEVTVYSARGSNRTKAAAPSLDEVCSQKLQERVEECQVLTVVPVVNPELDQVELKFVGRNESLPSVCVKNEEKGSCQRLVKLSVPLDSVTPCMCFQVWDKDDLRHSLSCPFTNTNSYHKNVWRNLSVSVGQGHMSSGLPMLSWNVSAPCRLEGEVWPCHRGVSCREVNGFRQQLQNGTWSQDHKRLWETKGAFRDIDLQLSPCVMVRITQMGHDLGPYCFNNTERRRWSLLVVGVLLLLCLTMIVFYLLHHFIKKWAWSCHRGGFVKVNRMRHVLLLSPPDVDDGVSNSVCHLGSLLSNHGFSVCVDQWSRREQCILGPLPWLHSQLMQVRSWDGQVVLVLSRKALERAEEWTRQRREDAKTAVDDTGIPLSPYSDVFSAALCIIHAEQQLGRVRKRFLLVIFDSQMSTDRTLPELFQGLPLFQLPTKTQALLTELSVGEG